MLQEGGSIPHPEEDTMLKKLLVLAAGAAISFNASAGYIRYDFEGGSASNISGFIVQRDDNKAIAFYSIVVTGQNAWAQFTPMYGSNISAASTNYAGQGPTSFNVYSTDDVSSAYNHNLAVFFDGNERSGSDFFFVARFEQQKALPYDGLHNVKLTFDGLVTKGVVDPALSGYLDAYDGYDSIINRIIPTTATVPEPATLGLFVLGALGAAGAARRRNTAR